MTSIYIYIYIHPYFIICSNMFLFTIATYIFVMFWIACTWRWLRSEANGGDGESDQGQLLSTVAVTKKDAAMHGEGDEIPGVWLSDTVTVVFRWVNYENSLYNSARFDFGMMILTFVHRRCTILDDLKAVLLRPSHVMMLCFVLACFCLRPENRTSKTHIFEDLLCWGGVGWGGGGC